MEDILWDAVVVGAGPAGSMSALQLSRMGKRVALLERQRFPRWKVCGATVSLGAQDLLIREGLGDILEDAAAPPLHTLRLGGWGIQAELPLNGTRAISRSYLDSALVHAAVRNGARFFSGARAKLGDLLPDGRELQLTLGGQRTLLSTRVVIAADGLASSLMSQAGEPSVPTRTSKRPLVGLGGTFPSSVPGFESGKIHMAVGANGYVGMARVEDRSLNVAAALNPATVREAESPHRAVSDLLLSAGWPELPEPPAGGWKGTVELTRRPQRPGAERLFAVGDAAGYVEPFTGEGILWALEGARAVAPLAARVAESWEPSLLDTWTETHQRLFSKAQRLCRLTSWTLAKPAIVRPTLQALKWNPHLAAPLVRRVGLPLASPQ